MHSKCSQFRQGDRVGIWVLQEEIGKGSFASVWRADSSECGSVVAIKIICVRDMQHKLRSCLSREIDALFKIRHLNVIELYDSIETENEICLITEFCKNGELSLLCKSATRHLYDEHQRISAFKQIVDGLEHLHCLGYVHRDIKPQNILIDDAGHIKIADLGFVCDLSISQTTETLCGSPMYMAPEILLQKKYDGRVDVWSLGVVIFELFEGHPPFPGINCEDLLRLIRRNWRRLPDRFTDKMPKEIQLLLMEMLIPFPDQRMTLRELKAHPSFRDILIKHDCNPQPCESMSVLPVSKNCDDIPSLVFEFSESKLLTDSVPELRDSHDKYQNQSCDSSKKSKGLSPLDNKLSSDANDWMRASVDHPRYTDDFVFVTSPSQGSFFQITPRAMRHTTNTSNSPSSLQNLSTILGTSPALILKSWAQFVGIRGGKKRARRHIDI